LLCTEPEHGLAKPDAIARARRQQAALEAHARVLLCRYGVVFRELLARETNAPKWRDLAPVLRRLEARGEIRGGRFVGGPFGEQFAAPEAVEGLREARRRQAARASEPVVRVAATDPLNLVGVLVPGERAAAIPGRSVDFQNGAVVQDQRQPADSSRAEHGAEVKPKGPRRSVAALLREGLAPARANAPASAASSGSLFS
jgi:ATP-dependent Lhr-like helicase